MAVWPSIQEPVHPLQESIFKRQIRSEFESGHVLSRAGSTVSKRTFSPRWTFMPEADFQTLSTFFEANIGLTFTWTHPVTLEVITVRFSEDKIESSIKLNGYRELVVGLEEAPS